MNEVVEVLVVDDEPDIREVAQLSLERDPHMRVRTAATADEALALMGRPHATPDIVLLDVMMAGVDGLTLLRAMRGATATAQVPVVFVTARTREADITNLIAQGAAGVITKPFDPLRLASRVRAILVESRGSRIASGGASGRTSGGLGPIAEQG